MVVVELSDEGGVFHLSKGEAIQLVKHTHNIEICEGSVINIEERTHTHIG
jgi:hypothetical protein